MSTKNYNSNKINLSNSINPNSLEGLAEHFMAKEKKSIMIMKNRLKIMN